MRDTLIIGIIPENGVHLTPYAADYKVLLWSCCPSTRLTQLSKTVLEIWFEYLWYADGAIFLLIIFHDRQQRSTNSQP